MIQISLDRSKKIFNGAILEAEAILSGQGDENQDPYSRANLETPFGDTLQAAVDCFAGGQLGILVGTIEYMARKVKQSIAK